MGNTVGGERQQGTLPLLLASPARRVPLFLGRALPVILNGFLVSVVALVGGALVLRVHLPASVWLPLAVAVAVCTFSCTGLGLFCAALALRVRETAVLGNVFFGILLVFAGINVPLDKLPAWMAATGQWLPLTHGIDAARRVATGTALPTVGTDLGREAAVGALYLLLGLGMLAWFERESRRRATLDSY
jgi:ABC-2 type transport system permease protein